MRSTRSSETTTSGWSRSRSWRSSEANTDTRCSRTKRPQQPVVLYDGDCGFCRWTLAKILAWDRQRRLRPVAIDSAEGARLLADLEPDERSGSWHFVGRDGRRSSAGAAAAPLLRELPGGDPLVVLAERFPAATARGYEWVARNRGRFGRAVPAGARRRADRRIAARLAG